MKHWIRWSYVAPRLAIAAAVVMAVWLGLDPLLRWSLVRLGQRIVAAKVEIGELKTSLARTEVCLRDVQVADPDKPMENLVEAKEVKFSLETDSLLRKRFVVTEGHVSGLRFGTERATPGVANQRPLRWKPIKLPLDGRIGGMAESWLDALADLLQAQVAKEIDQLESVQLARELSERWPREYEQMEDRANGLRARADALRKLAKGDVKNLLRDLDATRKAVSDMESLQRDVAQFRGELERLRQQTLRDRDAIQEARKHDLERIRERLRLDNLRGEHLSDYFLGPELAERVRTAAEWMRWTRQHWPERVEPSEPTRSRGIDILFAGLEQRSDYLLRKLTIDGDGSFQHQPYQFVGTIEGVTSQPALFGRPTTVKLEVQGRAKMFVEAMLDRTQEVAYDRITLECPDLPQPERLLGQKDRLALAVSPGKTRVSVVLHLEGEELWGRLSLRQDPVTIAAKIAPRYGGNPLAADLDEALGRIQTLDIVADISGTIEQPQWHLRSTLGSQVADAINWLIRKEIDARGQELAAHVQQKIDAEVSRFEQTLQSKQEALLAKANLSVDEIRELRERLASRTGVEKLLGKPLPANLPLRF